MNYFCCDQKSDHQFEVDVFPKELHLQNSNINTNHKQKSLNSILELVPKNKPDLYSKIAKHISKLSNDFIIKRHEQQIMIKNDKFEGIVDNNKQPVGFGKYTKSNGKSYIGQFVCGRAEGQGLYILSDGSFFFCRFQNNQPNDRHGFYISRQYIFEGQIKNGVFEGEGIEIGFEPQFQFNGFYTNGNKAVGRLAWKGQDGEYIYEGPFNYKGEFQGEGTLTQPFGVYRGEFHRGEKHGTGQYLHKNGTLYRGQYIHNCKSGIGELYNDSNKKIYGGNFYKGLPHGKGFIYTFNNQRNEVYLIQGFRRQNIMSHDSEKEQNSA